MRPEDLMIGDWVRCPGLPQYGEFFQVAEITPCICIDAERELFANPEDLEPIPLTPEILEKNGFRKQKWNDLVTEFVFAKDLEQTPQTVIQFTFYSREIEGVKSLLRMWTKSQFGHGQNDVHLCGVYYIHELQHALRLCGIEKEIII